MTVSYKFIEKPNFEERLRDSISVAWKIFARKVGGSLIPVNREASMQLQYAYVLKQILPLIIHSNDESADIELEAGVTVNNKPFNIDILLKGKKGGNQLKIAIEMKCYRKIAASGGKRGAGDIFMKDVYEDLDILEKYVAHGVADVGVALVLNDHENFINPKNKNAKCWDYDISNGHSFKGGRLTTPVGGKPIDINLSCHYDFIWDKYGDLYFMELQGKSDNAALNLGQLAHI